MATRTLKQQLFAQSSIDELFCLMEDISYEILVRNGIDIPTTDKLEEMGYLG